MVSVLSGSNQYAIQTKLSEIKQAFTKLHGVAGVESYTGDQIEAASLGALLGGATLFATHRLVVIKHLTAQKDLAEAFLHQMSRISEEVHIVLVESQLDKRTSLYKTLKKDADFYEFDEPSEAELGSWAQTYVKSNKGTIGADALRLLLQYVGTDQMRLSHELDKLLAYSAAIDTDAVRELIEPNPQDTVFELLERALQGKTDQALRVLNNLENAHEDPFQVANMLIWQTHILAVVSSSLTQNGSDVAKRAKLNPYVIQKTKNLAVKFSRTKLGAVLDVVAQLDVMLKTTSNDPWRVLEQTLIAL